MPIKQNEITVANVTNGLFLDPCSFTFPCRPSLLTCTELQVRLDTVNADQDSNILAYIPLEKFQEGYIVCHNLYPKLTAKRIGYHQNDLVVLSLSQEDNFAISLDEVTIILEVLVFNNISLFLKFLVIFKNIKTHIIINVTFNSCFSKILQ